MKFSLTAFLFFCSGFFLSVVAQEKNHGGNDVEKKLHLKFYPGISFLKYHRQPGLLELTFPYSRLDTSNGGQIAEVFEYSRNDLPGNHTFLFPIVGLEISRGNFFLRGDIRLPKKRRISEEHLSFGYEYRLPSDRNLLRSVH